MWTIFATAAFVAALLAGTSVIGFAQGAGSGSAGAGSVGTGAASTGTGLGTGGGPAGGGLGTAGSSMGAVAQGATTQDPGRMAPGNLTTDRLGPSTGSPAAGTDGRLGAGDTPNGNWSGSGYDSGTTIFHRAPASGTGAAGVPGTAPDYGTTSGPGATRTGPSGASGTGAIGGGR